MNNKYNSKKVLKTKNLTNLEKRYCSCLMRKLETLN